MKSIFYLLIFALITSFVVPCDAKGDDACDACARIIEGYKRSNKNPNFNAKYSDVKACFESFPYDKKLAENTIETLKRTLQGFYIYLSKAKEEPKEGFSFRAVDLIKELDSLLSNDYKTDFQFMTDLQNSIADLKDAHLGFASQCYTGTFLFFQQLSLYSVINKDGAQIIKIFHDDIDKSTIDCEVTHIDGRPSIEVIKEFADTTTISRDAGTRFNDVLSREKFEKSNLINSYHGQAGFTTRFQLPKKSSMEYSLVCANNTSTKFTREWKTGSGYYYAFNTSKDYWNKFCLNGNVTLPKDKGYNSFGKDLKLKIDNIHGMQENNLVYNSTLINFFILSDNKTGVVVMPSVGGLAMSEDDFVDEMFNFQHGFKLLEDRGVQKLVFDLSNNLGGIIDLALFLVYLLFPDSDPSFYNDMVVSKLSLKAFVQATKQSKLESLDLSDFSGVPPPTSLSGKGLVRWAVKAAFYATSSGIDFDIYSYKNPKTDKHFRTVEEFIGNNTYVRGGIPTQFTSKFVYRNSERIGILTKLLAGTFHKYKWKAEDMIILTNGICGSSCALISQRMAEKHNVSTVGVGGFKDIPLSYSAFAGGQVLIFDALLAVLGKIGLLQNENLKELIPSQFKAKVAFGFTLKEIYDVNNQDDILELSFKPAKHRLYYDELSARDPSRLWLEVAKKI